MIAIAIAYIAAHWAGVTLAAGLILTPAVMTMPSCPPKTFVEWWLWLYDYLHALSNSRNPDAFQRRESVTPPKES